VFRKRAFEDLLNQYPSISTTRKEKGARGRGHNHKEKGREKVHIAKWRGKRSDRNQRLTDLIVFFPQKNSCSK
jgi:hypothetical protein